MVRCAQTITGASHGQIHRSQPAQPQAQAADQEKAQPASESAAKGEPRCQEMNGYSAVAPEAATARPHFSASAATKRAASSSDCGAGTRPIFSMRSLISRSLTAATIEAFSFCSASRGVPAVVKKPYQPPASKPGTPDSAIVGTAGSDAMRRALVVASILTRPLCTNWASGPNALNVRCTLPETRSGAICWMPL